MNVLALITGNGERFVFIYDDQSFDELLKTIAQYEAEGDLTEVEATTLCNIAMEKQYE
jgi:hypothetical protein